MSDVVGQAIANQEDRPGHGELTWSVTFINNETKSGTIGIVGDGTYALEKGERVWFFTSDKVIYLHPLR